MTRTLLFLSLLVTIAACRKKADCDGTVFSKHHVPMPNLPMQVFYSEGGKSQIAGHYEISTNNEGRFSFDKKISKKKTLEGISIQAGDSGKSYNRPSRNMEIVLQ